MARTFAYCRVSTLGQTVENQIREIEAAGFHVEKRRRVTETVSGSSAIEQRPGFLKLLDRLERDDVLVVTATIGYRWRRYTVGNVNGTFEINASPGTRRR